MLPVTNERYVMASQDRVWTPEALAAANERNIAEGWSSIGRAPGWDVMSSPALVCVSSGLPNPALNGVFHTALQPDDADEQIAATVAWFAERHVPMLWWVGGTATPVDLDERLTAQGFVPVGTTPAMAVALDNLPESVPVPAGCSITRACDEASFRDL